MPDRLTRALTAAVVMVAAASAAMAALPRVDVVGPSMAPTLFPGDRLVVVPRWVAPGRLVVLRDPRAPERTLVKRATAVAAGGVEVLGDNPVASTDSRHFGAVPWSAVIGRPVYRYAPAERAGWLVRR